jgi:methenyltetrahydrofolate cyclohydrolase
MGLDEFDVFEEWLNELASSFPTPGGGAVAALNAAMAASLIGMVCNLTIGKPKYAAVQEQMFSARRRAEEARHAALPLIEEDKLAFNKVMDAYRLPRATDEEKAHRANLIEVANVGAAAVPLRVAQIAVDVIGLAEEIRAGANTNVLSDVAVAASTARTALESSLVNAEINLAGVPHEKAYTPFKQIADDLAPALERADVVVREIRRRITG